MVNKPNTWITVMGCDGARERRFATGAMRAAMRTARSCARRGAAVAVRMHTAMIEPGASRSYIVFRCTSRGGCTNYSTHTHTGSFKSWERQQRADGLLGRGKRRRRK